MKDGNPTISGLRVAYDRGRSAADVVRETYRRIEAAQDAGIFIPLIPEAEAVARADALGAFDPSRPLWGVPFAVKDNIDIAGLPTTVACPDYNYTPQQSAPVVDRLIEAGAILIGKTNLDQFATGLVGTRTPYPVPRNAFDPTIVPGGSSSGSAVAVSLGIVPFSLGTDTAGSGRVPAALNNIVGLKPTCGALSTRGVVPACRTLDCVSIFATTVADSWTVFEALAAYDEQDPYSRNIAKGTMAIPSSVRFAVPDTASRIFGSDMAEAAFDAALALLPKAGLGASIATADLSAFYETARLLYEGAWVAERYAAIRDFIEAQPQSLLPVTRQIIEGARKLSAADAFVSEYRLAELRRISATFWNDFDVMIVPSIPDVCTLDEVAREPVAANSRLGTYTNFVNLLDLAAIAVPGPFRSDGLPAGVTLIAPAGRDGMLAAAAERLHYAAGTPCGATGAALPPQPRRATGTRPGTIEIVVVGAHMSGMALNGELTGRDGVFLRSVATDKAYRLFALPGGPPARPGLVRVNGDGAAIATEVWALPPEGFASFVAGIPSPLGIGTIALADGTSAKGFLCEAVATEGARDITSFGGWRNYVASLA